MNEIHSKALRISALTHHEQRQIIFIIFFLAHQMKINRLSTTCGERIKQTNKVLLHYFLNHSYRDSVIPVHTDSNQQRSVQQCEFQRLTNIIEREQSPFRSMFARMEMMQNCLTLWMH